MIRSTLPALAVLVLAASASAMTVEEFRALPDDKVAVRTSYGLRSARSIDDRTIEAVIGLSVTPVCSRPEAWRIVEGKLYLNYSKSVQAQWAGDIAGNIAKGDANWPRVLE